MTSPLPSRQAFARQIGSRFRTEAAGRHPFDLELLQLDETRAAPGHEAFSLVFGGPPDAPVTQATYRLRHPEVGPLDLFLVPLAADDRAVRYEAVINRPAGPAS